MIRRGTIVFAPWRDYGDDTTLTGKVVSIRRGMARVIWNDDGDTTRGGDESLFPISELEPYIVKAVDL